MRHLSRQLVCRRRCTRLIGAGPRCHQERLGIAGAGQREERERQQPRHEPQARKHDASSRDSTIWTLTVSIEGSYLYPLGVLDAYLNVQVRYTRGVEECPATTGRYGDGSPEKPNKELL